MADGTLEMVNEAAGVEEGAELLDWVDPEVEEGSVTSNGASSDQV